MMTSRYPEITDDLLSAYIDGAVTGAERIAVEQAAGADPDVAWRLKTLQETVQLLRMLPAVPAPRSFVMTAGQVGGATSAAHLPDSVSLEQARVARTAAAPAERSLGAWERMAAGWHNFWQRGNLPLRNAMAASMALLLLLLLVPSLLSPPANPIAFETSLAPAVPASDFLSNTLAAPEAQNRAQPLVQRAAPVSAGIADASEPEAPLSEAATVDWSATPEQTMQNVAAGEAATAAPAGSGARVLAAQPSVDTGLPAAAAGVDGLAFAPAAADQAVVEELTGAGAVVPAAAAALPNAAPRSGSAEPGEKLPAEPVQPAVPVAAAPVAVPTSLAQPAIPAVTPVAAPTDRPVQLLPTAVDDTAAALPAEGAALPTVPPTAQGQTWLWFQWLAAFAVVVFGFLWWRSRRAP